MGSSSRIPQAHSEDESSEVSAPPADVLGHVNAKFQTWIILMAHFVWMNSYKK